MNNSRTEKENKTNVFAGLVVSVIKIFIVIVIILTFIFYITTPPDTRSFFTNSTQSDTIVRTVDPA